jgi:hypothetical protein
MTGQAGITLCMAVLGQVWAADMYAEQASSQGGDWPPRLPGHFGVPRLLPDADDHQGEQEGGD